MSHRELLIYLHLEQAKHLADILPTYGDIGYDVELVMDELYLRISDTEREFLKNRKTVPLVWSKEDTWNEEEISFKLDAWSTL